MSFPSTREVVSQQVFNPTGLAIFASLGIHSLLLGFGFPSLLTGAKADILGLPRPVNVIELTPAEQTRLPDLSTPAFEPSDLGNLPSNSPLPDISNLNTALPPASLPNAWDSLPQPPLLPPLNYGSRLPIALPPQSLPRFSFPRSLTPPPPPFPSQTAQFPGSNFPNNLGNRPNFGPLPPSTNPEQLINRKFDPNTGQPIAAANSGTNAATSPPVNDEDLRWNAANTTNTDLIQNAGTWLAENNVKTPKAIKEIMIGGNYPQAACLKKLSGMARYVVSINPQGGVAGEPRQLQSTGYGILNRQAARDIKSSSFPKPSPDVPYYYVTVRYQFNPQVCPDASAVNSPLPQPALNPAVSPSPRPSPAATTAVPTTPKAPEIPAATTIPKPQVTPAASPAPSPSPTAAAKPQPKPQVTPAASPTPNPSPGIPEAAASPQPQPEETQPTPEAPIKSSQSENGPLGVPAARKKL